MTTPVTKPFLPPLAELMPYLETIWATKVLSNGGQLHASLEQQLTKFLSVENLSLFCNATTALMVAQRALDLSGEIITTPYSFAATAHAIRWLGNKAVFVDIDPATLCLNPSLIEEQISDRTVAIMPLHCYGNMCDVDQISTIAAKYDLKVIYDACHSFGVQDGGGSALRHGDISVVSLHATKVFNTFEGGALVTSDAEIKARVERLKNFGFVDEVTVDSVGINGKMSEFNAAVGLLQLKYFNEVNRRRGDIDRLYRERLANVSGLQLLSPAGQVVRNYAYFPILVTAEYPESRDDLYRRLRGHGINGRRYFYPLIPEFPPYKSSGLLASERFPVSFGASRQVICLPLYPDLALDEVERICDVIARCGG